MAIPRVLVVEQDPGLAERLAWWLDEAGFEVMICGGPTAPGFDCVGSSASGCPLAHGADLVVLDVWTAADAAVQGWGGLRLLQYYSASGLPVVAIRQRRDALDLRFDDVVVDVEWPPDRRDLVETVRATIGFAAR